MIAVSHQRDVVALDLAELRRVLDDLQVATQQCAISISNSIRADTFSHRRILHSKEFEDLVVLNSARHHLLLLAEVLPVSMVERFELLGERVVELVQLGMLRLLPHVPAHHLVTGEMRVLCIRERYVGMEVRHRRAVAQRGEISVFLGVQRTEPCVLDDVRLRHLGDPLGAHAALLHSVADPLDDVVLEVAVPQLPDVLQRPPAE